MSKQIVLCIFEHFIHVLWYVFVCMSVYACTWEREREHQRCIYNRTKLVHWEHTKVWNAAEKYEKKKVTSACLQFRYTIHCKINTQISRLVIGNASGNTILHSRFNLAREQHSHYFLVKIALPYTKCSNQLWSGHQQLKLQVRPCLHQKEADVSKQNNSHQILFLQWLQSHDKQDRGRKKRCFSVRWCHCEAKGTLNRRSKKDILIDKIWVTYIFVV